MQAKLSMGVSVRDGLCTSVAPERRHDAKSSENSTIFSLSARVASPPPQHMISQKTLQTQKNPTPPSPRRKHVEKEKRLYFISSCLCVECVRSGDRGVGRCGGEENDSLFSFLLHFCT